MGDGRAIVVERETPSKEGGAAWCGVEVVSKKREGITPLRCELKV
jgi:hypothetical protein